MAEDGKPAEEPVEPPISNPILTVQGAISDEALRKAEAYIEADETNWRLSTPLASKGIWTTQTNPSWGRCNECS